MALIEINLYCGTRRSCIFDDASGTPRVASKELVESTRRNIGTTRRRKDKRGADLIFDSTGNVEQIIPFDDANRKTVIARQ